MRKLFSYLKPYRLPIGAALFLMLLELAVELVQPLLMAAIIDEGIMKNDLDRVLIWGSVMIGISLLSFAAGATNSFFASHVSQSFGYDVRLGLMEKLQSFSFNNLQKFSNATLITRMTNDVTQVQNTVFMGVRIMMRAPLLLFGGVIMALLVDVQLALILVITIPILFLFLVWALNRAGKLFTSVQERLDAVNSVMRENLSGMRLIKAFVRGQHEIGRFGEVNEKLRDRTITALRLIEFTMPVLILVMNLSVLVVLWFGNIKVETGGATVGEVVAILNYGTRMTSALSVMTWILMVISRAKASARRIADVFDAEVDAFETEEGDQAGQIREGKVEFDKVSFHYPGTDTAVLSGISFSVAPGETVAFLGETGSGKTSLFQLIPRLYDVNAGKVRVDGKDVRQIDTGILRRAIGFVPQEAVLFSGSVKDNISWGKTDASMNDIIAAAQDAQIHETIENLPARYDTKIGQKGINLSGGQKQRLSIARALVRKPKILLLDDSTSALDLKTEAKLLDAIESYQCTILIITQKISTAMKADRIILLENGEIAGAGNHHHLLDESALYRKIVQSQNWKGEEVSCSRN